MKDIAVVLLVLLWASVSRAGHPIDLPPGIRTNHVASMHCSTCRTYHQHQLMLRNVYAYRQHRNVDLNREGAKLPAATQYRVNAIRQSRTSWPAHYAVRINYLTGDVN